MPRPMRFILLAVLLALPVAWWILRAAPGEPSAPGPAGAHAPPSSSAAPSPRAPALTAEASEEDSEDPEDGGVEDEEDPDEAEGTGPCISVEVTAHGAPVPGAHVTAARRDDERSFTELKPLDVGPDGRGQAWCAPGTYLLAARARGFAPSVLQVEESDGGTPALARIQLQPGNAVNGRVLDKDSQEPVPQAKVTLEPLADFPIEDADAVIEESSVTSDARGAFRVEDLATGTYRVSVEAPGHSSKETEIKIPRPEPLTLELEGTCHLEGEVVDPAGAPAAGAEVWVNSGSSDDEPPPRTDAQGHFSIEVEEGTYTLMARAGAQTGVHEGAITVVRGGLVDGLLIRLRPSGTVSGKAFLQSTQAPVPHGLVAITHEDSGWTQSVMLDAQGTFRLEHTPPGKYGLTLFSTGLPQTRRDDLHVEAGQELVVELPVIRESSVEGRLTDGLGRPAAGSSVVAQPLNASTTDQSRSWSQANEEGQYVLPGLSPGSYRIEARWSSNRWSPESKPLVQEVTLHEGETAHADFAFTEVPGEVQGAVQFASGGLPHYAVRVAAYAVPVAVATTPPRRPEAASEDADETGHFTLRLMPGAYTLKALYSETSDPGPEQPVTVEAGKVSQVRLTVPDSVTETSGVVLNSRGEPASGASVSLIGDDLYATADTDAQGHFTLRSSREHASATGDLRAESEAEEAELSDVHAGSKNLVVHLARAAALRGRVSAARGPAVQGFTLRVARKDNAYSALRNASPFAGDTFELVDLPATMLELQVRTSDGRCGSAVVQTEPGQTANVELSVGTLGRVTGRLLTAAGAPRSTWVHVDSDTEHLRDGYASKDGRFEVIALEPGPHVLKVDRGQQVPFTLHEGEALDLGDLTQSASPYPR